MSETARFPSETVLVVDDEDSVRRTFREWLVSSDLDVNVVAAADAESALRVANQQPIDLAVLDWNLGSGSDGLQLLEDLSLFHPDIVAILITGFAHQATPLDALRLGVRDYLDKNQDLNRETFLRAVRKQLDRIRPARRQRAFNQSLREFREAVEKILPLVQATSALNDPVPLPQAIAGLFRFVIRATGAADGVLIVRHADNQESYRAYAADGKPFSGTLISFADSIAASVVSSQEPNAMGRDEIAAAGKLQPFERGRSSLLASPLNVGPGTHAVMELFDKRNGAFTNDDRQLAQAAAEFGAEILRHALAERQKHQMLFDAIGAALGATERLALAAPAAETGPEAPPPGEVLDQIRHGLGRSRDPVVGAEASLELAEAVRVLAVRYGPSAVRHCTRVIQSLRQMLDSVTGME
jgi:two-component system nitrogen regulation response regulator NtrX